MQKQFKCRNTMIKKIYMNNINVILKNKSINLIIQYKKITNSKLEC